uniref:Uncharacterized protein n=1 Tax=Cacopsylla melanoneura TaxID=428564 RepID=A0A8D9E8W2_9HEMI
MILCLAFVGQNECQILDKIHTRLIVTPYHSIYSLKQSSTALANHPKLILHSIRKGTLVDPEFYYHLDIIKSKFREKSFQKVIRNALLFPAKKIFLGILNF